MLVAGAALLAGSVTFAVVGGPGTEPVEAGVVPAVEALPPPPTDGDVAAEAVGSAERRGPAPWAAPRRALPPDRLRVPSIGVDGPVVPIGTDRTGALQVPQDGDLVGWWAAASRRDAPAYTAIPCFADGNLCAAARLQPSIPAEWSYSHL